MIQQLDTDSVKASVQADPDTIYSIISDVTRTHERACSSWGRSSSGEHESPSGRCSSATSVTVGRGSVAPG